MMSRSNQTLLGRRTIVKGVAGVAALGILAGCGDDEEIDPEPDAQEAHPATDP